MKEILNSILAGSLLVGGTGVTSNILEVKKNDKEEIILTELYKEIINPTNTVKTTDDSKLKDIQTIKLNYVSFMCGNEETNINGSESIKQKIKEVHSKGSSALQKFIPNTKDRSTGIFSDANLADSLAQKKDSNAFSTTAKHLQEMALAYATPGQELYHNEELKNNILDGLQYFHDKFFNSEELMKKYYGNWYNWEIAIPTSLSSLFILMSDEIEAEKQGLMNSYVVCMDRYLQNGINGDVDLNARFYTGANLADITMNRILQGVITQDANRITKAVSDMMTVYHTIDPNNILNNNTDGVYEDGSFIQHHRVAYTGSYGVVLLQRIAQSVIVLENTKFQPKGHMETIKKWIYNSFTPVTFEGYMMEIVKGRGVSRMGTGYNDMTKIIDSMLLVIPYMDKTDAYEFKEQVKYSITSMPQDVQPKPSAFSLGAIKTYEGIMADQSILPVSHSAKGHYAFNSMDKNVHLRDDYAFSLSRSSNRIAKYEYMSGENKRSWFHGDGAFYLYQSGRDQRESYGAEYYAAGGAYNLPGTTVPVEKRKTIQEWHNGKDFYDNPSLGFESGSENQNDYVYFPVGTNHYSGSVTLDNYAAAGMQLGDDNAYAAKQKGLLPDDFVVYKNAEANKAWFMFDDEIVVMSSNIHDTQHRELISTIDNRMSSIKEKIDVEIGYNDGKEEVLKQNGVYKNVDWIHYKTDSFGTDIGYYFLENKDLKIENGSKTGNLMDIKSNNPNKDVTHNFFTMTYSHDKSVTNDSYSYVILPNADTETTKKNALNPQIDVLENNEKIQAVAHNDLKMKGYMFYGKAKTDGISSESSASVMMKESEDGVTIAVSDPTFEQSMIDLTIDMKDAYVVSGGENIYVESKGNQTILHVNVDKQNGKTFEVTLKEKDTIQLHGTLTSLIKKVEGLTEADYTPQSWNVLENALSNAKAVNENKDATVNELETSIKQLENALNQLKKIEVTKDKEDNKVDEKIDSVKTGYQTNTSLYFITAFISMICGVFVFKKKKTSK